MVLFGWARSSFGRARKPRAICSPEVPRTPFSHSFQAQEFEVHKFEAACQALASAQQTPQNPDKTAISEKSADRRASATRVDSMIGGKSVFW